MFIFRAIKKHTSNYNARETLRRLEAFLDENSPQLVYWLANLFNGQQNSISYAELEAAALAGYEAQIRQWQQEYAKFVNDKLNPMWLLAIGAGAKQFELKHGKPLDDSDFFVKNWLNNHAGQFITNINAETRQAIKSILYYCQDQQLNPKQIAQAIRPTIGLTQQQAITNLRYKEHVKRALLRDHPRMSEAKAEERAQRAALKYSSQQQRYRAETIARTELAFAYNRGAHESVRQAVANGLMGRCEKVWETAGTQRTCGRCMELNGKVVGFDDKFFDSKIDLGDTPPLHPRCRCVIIYREVESPKIQPVTFARNYQSNLSQSIGKNHYDAARDILDKASNQKAAKVWVKFENEIKVANINQQGTPFHQAGELYLNIKVIAAGQVHKKPYQTLFHEGGHNIDWLLRLPSGFYYSATYKNGAFIKAIHDDVDNLLKAYNIDENAKKNLLAEIKRRYKVGDVKWFVEQGYIPDDPRGVFPLFMREEYVQDKEGKKRLQNFFKNLVKMTIGKNRLKLINDVKKSGDLKVYGCLSDILEGATKENIKCGIGHPTGHWKKGTINGIEHSLGTEAFAHFMEAGIANDEALELLESYLPNASKVFDEMLDDLIGGSI